MERVKRIGALTALVLGVIVILQNTHAVETRFLFLKVTMPNAVLLGLTLLVGIALGVLMALIMSSRRGATRK